jgi:hypothetical protein
MMKKALLVLVMGMLCRGALGGTVGLPLERIALPAVDGEHLVCVWDAASGTWFQAFEQYDHAGAYGFELPEWNQWYWVGLWDSQTGEYAFGKWVGHFVAE